MEHGPVPSQGRSQHGAWPSHSKTGRGGGRDNVGRGDYQAMQEQQALHQSNDVLTLGITTEVHAVAQGLRDDHGGVPYDPNLTCVSCGKVFRIGEIQLYRSHNATCAGTVV